MTDPILDLLRDLYTQAQAYRAENERLKEELARLQEPTDEAQADHVPPQGR